MKKNQVSHYGISKKINTRFEKSKWKAIFIKGGCNKVLDNHTAIRIDVIRALIGLEGDIRMGVLSIQKRVLNLMGITRIVTRIIV